MQINLLNLSSHAASFCIAVSGGIDSISLAFAVRDSLEPQRQITCLTVDHGLRGESATEAAEVQAYLNLNGFNSVVLKWGGEKPATAIQEKARDARYKLMTDYCIQHGIGAILTAHNLGDNIETMLQRLIRGSGVSGLAGISEVSEINGIKILRPMLTVSRAEIQEYAAAHKLKWWDDPSNITDKYQRNRIRKIVEALKAEGLEEGRLTQTISALKSANDALEHYAAAALRDVAEIYNSPVYAVVDVVKLAGYPSETARRVLLKVLQITGSGEEIRQEKFQRFHADLLSAKQFKKWTIGGVEIELNNEKAIFLREQIKTMLAIESDGEVIFDKKYRVTLRGGQNRTLQVGYLTQSGWNGLSAELRNRIITKKRILYSMPAIFELENVVSVPHISYLAKGCEDLEIQIAPVLKERI